MLEGQRADEQTHRESNTGKEEKCVTYPGGLSVYPGSRRIVMEGETCVDANEALEWAVVMRGGRDYESVVMVDAAPSLVHFALVALGFEEGGGVERQGDPNTPTGDKLVVHVEWEQDGSTITRRLEDLVWNDETEKPMCHTPFVFTGSMTIFDKQTGKSKYIADEEKIVVALYRDPSAVLNNPMETGADDIFYVVHKKAVPPKGTKVKVTLSAAGKKSGKEPEQSAPAQDAIDQPPAKSPGPQPEPEPEPGPEPAEAEAQ